MRYFIFITLFLLLLTPYFSQGEELFPVEFINKSQIADDQEVYITVKGLNPESGEAVFARFDSDGKAQYIPVAKGTETTDFAFKLSDLQGTLYFPYLASGRIYISIGEPMRFRIDNEGEKAVIVDADGFKPRDPNYYILYDKVEFSYVKEGTWMNPTAVDFFSLPLRIEQPGSATFKETGISLPRAEVIGRIDEVLKSFDRTPDHEWKKLWLKYKSREGEETNLRLASPGKAMIPGVPGTNPFNPNYLKDWTDAVWEYYRSNEIKIDTRELQGAGNPLSDYLFKGKVEGDNFIFINGDGSERVEISKPESISWFAGAQGVFDAPNNTPKAIIVRQLTSAFDVGLLPAENGQVVDRNYFDQQREEGQYYQANSFLPPTEQGPWFDLYSMALHSLGEDQPIYTFAYDDALGQDGTLHDPKATKAVITLGDMSGTVIPHPFQDDQTYTVQISIGDKSSVIYQGRELQKSETLKGVTVPMEVELNGTKAELYFNPQIVLPNFKDADGIVIDLKSETEAQVTFPGKA